MAITAETRTHLIGLSVVMLGEAPGTERLGDWVGRYDDGMSLEAIANHIAGSSAFRAEYPNFDTNRDFAEKFLGNLMGGEDVSADLVSAAVDIVVGLLNDGMTRGALALAVVGAMLEINAQGAAHPAHGDLGGVAARLANQVEVAEYHTLTLRKADSSSDALAGVTSDAASVDMAKLDLDQDYDAMFDPVGELTLDEHADGSGEGNAIGVGHVTASDGDGDTVAYSIKGDPDGWAILDDGKLCYVGMGIDYEEMTSVDLTIVATSTGADGTETSVEQMVTVNIVNDPADDPADAVFNPVGELTLEENADGSGEGNAISVGNVTASDANGDEVAYSIKGDPADWAILEDGKLCYIGTGVDYEAMTSVDLTIVATSIGANGEETSVEQMVTVQIGDVDDLPDEPMRFVLTPTIDDIQGGDADDTIVAQPIAQVSNVFQDVLNPFDTIDGGGGTDTIHIFGVDPADMLTLGAEDISNVENVVINTVGGIHADLTDWDGVEMVDLRRFGDDDDVTVIVDDGATVGTSRTFGGEKVVIAGASGSVDIEAGESTMVHVGSADQTESVMVKGGGSILIDNGAGKQSQTVTSVSVEGVKAELGKDVPGDPDSADYMAMTDDNGYVVGQNGTDRISIQVGTSGTPVVRVGIRADGTLTNADTGAAIIVEDHPFDHDKDATTTAIDVNVALRFNEKAGGIVFGAIQKEGTGDAAAFPEGITDANASDLDGMALPDGVVVIPTPSIGKVRGEAGMVPEGAKATLTINSDSIADVSLTKTNAIVLVQNESKTAAGRAMPEDLSVTVDGYGSFDRFGNPDQEGKLCVAGSGSAENIMLTVAGASNVDLNSNVVKMLDVSADARLNLTVSKFNADGMPVGPSETLESVTVSGEGGVSMDSLDGMRKLASIDASGSSGKNSFKSMSDGAITELNALTMAMGGSGSDTFALGTSSLGKLESVTTGDGDDTVMVGGDDYRDDGLMVDLGAGDDTFHGNAGNEDSRIDGGDGRDTLRLSTDGVTYKDGDDTMSIYSNFEILDVGDGSGKYNVKRLGIDTIVANKSTDGLVTLEDVSGGTALRVTAEKAGTGTTAIVKYDFADDVNVAGSIIDGGTTNILNVSLMAKGGAGGTKFKPGPGAAVLEIELDADLLAMSIDSNASVHRVAAGKGVTSGHYQNKVTVNGDSSALEEVKITGNAQTMLGGPGLTSLAYVNASESGAKVDVDASSSAVRVRLVGSHNDDDLTAGDFAGAGRTKNTLTGNGGDDSLTGGTGQDILIGGAGADTLKGFRAADETTAGVQRDLFVYNAASDSQVTFVRNEEDGMIEAKGYDTITGFDSGTAATDDRIVVSKTLFAALSGNVKNTVDAATGEWNDWMRVDSDGDPATTGATNMTATTFIDGNTNKASLGADGEVGGGDDVAADGGATDLRSFIGNGKGLFRSTEADATNRATDTNPLGLYTAEYSIAVVRQEGATVDNGLWVLFDVDGNGDFDADTDMVIFLAGVTDVATGFVGADLMSA